MLAVCGLKAGLQHVRVQLRHDLLEIGGSFRKGIGLSIKIVKGLRARKLRRKQIRRCQAKLFDESPKRRMSRVDQHPAPLDDLSVVKSTSPRIASPAYAPMVRFEDRRGIAGLLQPIRACQSGKSCSDDGDSRRLRRSGSF